MKNLRAMMTVLATMLAACSPAEPPASGTAITNVTVIDAVNGERPAQTVIFDGDRIVSVQPAGDAGSAAETIDGSGRYLVPGLWDMHVHLVYEDELIDAMPSLFLAHGITSVRDTGGLIEKVRPVVDAMRAADAIAPRVFFAGPLLDGRYVVYDGDGRPEIGAGNPDPAAARANVRELQEQGVDFIKIYEMVAPEVFEALHETARELGLPIAAHVPLSLLAGQAGPQVDSMEHLRNVELDCASNAAELHEERLAMLANPDGIPGGDLRSRMHSAQRDAAIANYDEARCGRTIDSLRSTIQVPTLRLNTFGLNPPYLREDFDAALALLPDEFGGRWRQSVDEMRARDTSVFPTGFGEWSLELVGRMNAAGVPIGAGTDAPLAFAVPGYSLHTELERLVAAGLSPIEAIEAATVQPARFFSLDDEMGLIEPGMRADLVLLDANPLDDIGNTRTVHRVVSQGRVLDPAELLDAGSR